LESKKLKETLDSRSREADELKLNIAQISKKLREYA
jgi:hypothetical protein